MRKADFDLLRINDFVCVNEYKVKVIDIDRTKGLIQFNKTWHDYHNVENWIRHRNKRNQTSYNKEALFKRMVRCISDNKEFTSVRECANYYGIHPCSVRNSAIFKEKVKKIGKQFEYIGKGYNYKN